MKRVEMTDHEAAVFYATKAERLGRMAAQLHRSGDHRDAANLERDARKMLDKAATVLSEHHGIQPYQLYHWQDALRLAANGWNQLSHLIMIVFVDAQKREGRTEEEAYAKLFALGIRPDKNAMQ